MPIKAFIGAEPGGEGYVMNHSQGSIKLVDRTGFTAANRQANARPVAESRDEKCPEACCGKPIHECKCGPECKHCDCYEKNKSKNESVNALVNIKRLSGLS